MKLPIRKLFWKIFLCFWATVVAIVVAIVITFIFEPQHTSSPWHENILQIARYAGTSAIEEAELHGATAATAYMQDLGNRTHTHACLTDNAGNTIADGGCTLFLDDITRAISTGKPQVILRNHVASAAVPLQSTSGKRYIYAAEIPTSVSTVSKAAVLTRVSIAILVSFCICYLLTRYLTDPVLHLRKASHSLAAGDLSTRASHALEQRNDELGSLVRDFNTMATQIEELISRQRQLTYDLSHELRSPLARLNIALDIVRERKGSDPAFDQAEQDLARMDEMIGRMLTMAKLDTFLGELQTERIDLTDLVASVVRSAEFESRDRSNAVSFTAQQPFLVNGNPELLHSAIENIMRNAIRYTPPETSVEVHLQHVTEQGKPFVQLSIHDHGPGVPESDLANIFRPFYRVGTDRDRQSGGAGLGLAIADRVIRLHGGTIRAHNAGGLCVEILLPSADAITA
ncbi:ATP-binding protein [Acidicapsa dinghuensis]|uniref:Signal transduction histidine-protein kinase/phosphatase MprB n=1 Tax=Acidicapsa dinghuensis TaxID=2218256 RepID=A0ABW1ECP9_9BACT|nr:ATP-binding protein [Acidicapsa dinghuensis]